MRTESDNRLAWLPMTRRAATAGSILHIVSYVDTTTDGAWTISEEGVCGRTNVPYLAGRQEKTSPKARWCPKCVEYVSRSPQHLRTLFEQNGEYRALRTLESRLEVEEKILDRLDNQIAEWRAKLMKTFVMEATSNLAKARQLARSMEWQAPKLFELEARAEVAEMWEVRVIKAMERAHEAPSPTMWRDARRWVAESVIEFASGRARAAADSSNRVANVRENKARDQLLRAIEEASSWLQFEERYSDHVAIAAFQVMNGNLDEPFEPPLEATNGAA